MKILVTGTYSSGKTSLCEKISKACQGQGWPTFCPVETARTLNLPLNLEQNGELSALLVGAQISMESSMETRSGILICDRGIPDIWSHNLALQDAGAEIKSHEIERLAKEWSQSYDLVIQSICNHNLPIPPDGIRVADILYRRRLEDFHRSAMAALDVQPDLNFNSSDESIEFVISQTLDYFRLQMPSKAS